MALCKPFYPRGNVEHWLLEVEGAMKKSVKEVLREAIAAYALTARAQWVVDWPGQVVLTASQMYLCSPFRLIVLYFFY